MRERNRGKKFTGAHRDKTGKRRRTKKQKMERGDHRKKRAGKKT
jgi:hypothetical protein